MFLVVLDSVGCGALPDAAAYGDEGSNTLGHIAAGVGLGVPNLRTMGLDRIVDLGPAHAGFCERDTAGPCDDGTSAGVGVGRPASRLGCAWGRMAEASAGKDSVTGHWEMMGLVLDRPFATFPDGFPPDLIAEFERRIGRGTLGNVVASGTDIIERLGPDHVRTGKPIIYTSADSVFQIAAHEEVVPVEELYRMCEVAFDLAARGRGVARVIARPFLGTPGAFARTARRHDYALDPPGDTLLDLLARAGTPVASIGKVKDLFAGRGITTAIPTSSDEDGVDRLIEAMGTAPDGLTFVNLVDFDTLYGHRNDVAGYAANLERFDARLGEILGGLRGDDLLVVTADHGNDPATPSTDHSREYVPVLLAGPGVRAGADLGTRATFADLGQTLASNFGVGPLARGTSFLEQVVVHHS